MIEDMNAPSQPAVQVSARPGACRAVVSAGDTYRFVELPLPALGRHGLSGAHELPVCRGGAIALLTPDRGAILPALDSARKRHNPAQIVLVVHHDCEKLGGLGHFTGPLAELATLETALSVAGDLVADRHPQRRMRPVSVSRAGTSSVRGLPRKSPAATPSGWPP